MENKASGLRASLALEKHGELWSSTVRYAVVGANYGNGKLALRRQHVHAQVAINEGLQLLMNSLDRLTSTQRQVLLLWARQVNRDVWAGITDEEREKMYQEEARHIQNKHKR